MSYVLAGDIGGTKTILRLAEVTQTGAPPTPCFEHQFSSQAYRDLVPMVQEFLQLAADQGTVAQPTHACFAIAGPVVNNQSQLTNLAWVLTAERLQTALNLLKVQLINDFAAVGYGVLGLAPDDLCTLQAGQPQATAPIAVIGAGTGLGEGFLVPVAGRHRVFPSEGGHADFAPRSALEFELRDYLLDKHQITRVSVERVVSGQGIAAIYQFLRDRRYAPATDPVASAIQTWERQTGLPTKTVDPAAVISQAAQAQTDPLSEQAMELFVAAYGAEAGNLALKLLPYGGLYVAGGVAAKNLSLMQAGGFLQAFGHKGRVSHLLDQVPVHIVLNPQVGLIGAAICAADLMA